MRKASLPESETVKMSKNVEIGGLAAAIMEQLEEYADLTTEGMKKAVTEAGKTVRKEIKASAPSRTGKYAKSWQSKKTAESASSLEVTVYSPSKYRLAHLLEHGHAKRGGGRTAAIPHIAPAEQKGIEQLERDIERCIKNG